MMMVEELGLSSDDENPFINSLVTFFAFGIFGLMPLLPFIVAKAQQLPMDDKYVWIALLFSCSCWASARVSSSYPNGTGAGSKQY